LFPYRTLFRSDLVKVDMCDVAAQGILLVVLDDGRVGGLLAVQDHVHDGVETVRTAEGGAKRALGHGERMGLLAAPVEDTRNQSLPAQATGLTGSPRVSLLDFQAYAFPSHGGGLCARDAG